MVLKYKRTLNIKKQISNKTLLKENIVSYYVLLDGSGWAVHTFHFSP